MSIPRAFPVGPDPAARLATLCGLAAETPFVGVEYDAATEDIRIVAEMPVEDARLTQLQLLALVDRVAAAAEAWHGCLTTGTGRRPQRKEGPRSPRAA